MQAGGSERSSFCRILQHAAVTGIEHPLIVRLSKEFYPIYVSRVTPTWQSGNILDVKSSMIFVLDESM